MSHLQGSNDYYPHHTHFTSPEDHWQAILRYDAARRQSSEVGKQTSHDEDLNQTSKTLNKATKRVKRMSIGDDLPHMPEEEVKPHESKRIMSFTGQKSVPQTSAAKYVDALKMIDDPYESEKDLTLGRQITPPAFKGGNSIMVNRELQRLREQKPRKIQRRWRIITGTMMLLVLAFSIYIFVQNLRAYFSLSPANWILSDSSDSTNTSPDPLLRSLALIETVAAGISMFLILASGFYLRLTRRKSCGSHLIWFAAIVSTTLNLFLSITNLALIAGWHKQYSDQTNDPLAKTRDVGQRCQGTWDLDILWDAAKSSLQSKQQDENCTINPGKTVESYLIAGGIRLIVFVLLCSIWLICLGHYNQVQRQDINSNDSIDESPEMHQLLTGAGGGGIEHGGLPEMPTLQSMPGRYYDEDVDTVAIYEEEKNSMAGRDSISTWNGKNSLARMPELPLHSSHATLVGSAPSIDRFLWQRGNEQQQNSYQTYGHQQKDAVVTYGNVSKHERDQSAGAWSSHIMDRLYHALWGSNHEHQNSSHANVDVDFQAVSHQEESLPWQHDREGTRLGVRGWFGRDVSGAHSRLSEDEGYEDESDKAKVVQTEINPPKLPVLHSRTSSQERRANQERHEAARRVYEKKNERLGNDDDDRFTSSNLESRSLSRKAAHERSLRKKQEQKDRIEFLASLGRGEDGDHPEDKSLPLIPQQKPRSSTSSITSTVMTPSIHTTLSNGERLPHMPSLQTPSAQQQQADSERLEEEDVIDESIFWRSSSIGEGDLEDSKQQRKGPIFVRQLGKLVRQLSAIESVGSGGERSQPYSPNSREPSSASGLF